jgi:hypothetical protein
VLTKADGAVGLGVGVDQTHVVDWVNKDGKPVIKLSPPKNCISLVPAGPKLLIATFDDGKFSTKDWTDKLTKKWIGLPSVDRIKEFARFQREYGLVGMSRAEVIALLGDETHTKFGPREICPYTLSCGDCGNTWSRIEVQFTDNKVKRWRTVAGDIGGEWITANEKGQDNRLFEPAYNSTMLIGPQFFN